jgi:phospholipid-binding lipoprotein MlaA
VPIGTRWRRFDLAAFRSIMGEWRPLAEPYSPPAASAELTEQARQPPKPTEVDWMRNRSLFHFAACVLLLIVAQPTTVWAADDPFEAVNRRIHTFNRRVQAKVLDPLVDLYLSTTSAEVRRGVGNALGNLGEPIIAVSGLAAGNVDLAMNAAARFGINSTIGFAGVRDRAAEMGYPRRVFGVADAICSWGVPSGPFIVLPLLGPSTLRDAGALVATSATLSQTLGPEFYFAWSTSDVFVGYAQLHHELNRIDAHSLDAYAVYRSAYLQRRAATCGTDRTEDLAGGAETGPPPDAARTGSEEE